MKLTDCSCLPTTTTMFSVGRDCRGTGGAIVEYPGPAITWVGVL